MRAPADFAELGELAKRIHALDGYPPYMPNDDFVGFLGFGHPLEAWVCELNGNLLGHVALHASSSEEVMDLASSALNLEDGAAGKVGVVSRLFVDPAQRRSGLAANLLGHAASQARRRGLTPILDVVEHFAPAIALYEREGWTRLGTARVQLPDRTSMHEHVYALRRT